MSTKALVGSAAVGGGLGLGTDAFSQTAAILDGTQRGWSFSRSAVSTGTGAVLLPVSLIAPQAGWVIVSESTLHGTFSTAHNLEDGHYWSAAADATNTVVIPLAIYKAPSFVRGPKVNPNGKAPDLSTPSASEKSTPLNEITQEVLLTKAVEVEPVGKASAPEAIREQAPAKVLEPQAVANAPPAKPTSEPPSATNGNASDLSTPSASEKSTPLNEITQEVLLTKAIEVEPVGKGSAPEAIGEQTPAKVLEPQAVANAPPAKPNVEPPLATTDAAISATPFVNPPPEARTTVPEEFDLYIFQTHSPCSSDKGVARAAARWELRPSDFKDVTVKENDTKVVLAQDPNGTTFHGVSTTVNPASSVVKGCYVKLPKGEPLPEGLVWFRDGTEVNPLSKHWEGHTTIGNTRKMTLKELKTKWETWIQKIVTDLKDDFGFIPRSSE